MSKLYTKDTAQETKTTDINYEDIERQLQSGRLYKKFVGLLQEKKKTFTLRLSLRWKV